MFGFSNAPGIFSGIQHQLRLLAFFLDFLQIFGVTSLQKKRMSANFSSNVQHTCTKKKRRRIGFDTAKNEASRIWKTWEICQEQRGGLRAVAAGRGRPRPRPQPARARAGRAARGPRRRARQGADPQI